MHVAQFCLVMPRVSTGMVQIAGPGSSRAICLGPLFWLLAGFLSFSL